MKLYSVSICMDDGLFVEYKHHYVYASSEGEVRKMLDCYYNVNEYWGFKYEYILEVENARILNLEK